MPVLVDTNVLSDVIHHDPMWFGWSSSQLPFSSASGKRHESPMKKNKPLQKGRIPLCKSERLQDVTIELGRRMKSARKANHTLFIEVSLDKSGLERLDFNASAIHNRWLTIVLWEDGLAWLFERKDDQGDFQCYSQFAPLSAYEIADVIRTGLLDLDSSRAVWIQHGLKESSVD